MNREFIAFSCDVENEDHAARSSSPGLTSSHARSSQSRSRSASLQSTSTTATQQSTVVAAMHRRLQSLALQPLYRRVSANQSSPTIPHPPRLLLKAAETSRQRRASRSIEARTLLRERLASAVALNEQHAAKRILLFYRDSKRRRAEKEAHRLRRELVVAERIRNFRRERAHDKFRSIVRRYMQLINNPKMQWRWKRIQAWFRGARERKQFATQRRVQTDIYRETVLCQAHNRGALTLQTLWRSFSVRRHGIDSLTYLAVRKAHAARIIQRNVRRRLFSVPAARRRASEIASRDSKAAAIMQRAWRAYAAQLRWSVMKFQRHHRLVSRGDLLGVLT